MVPIWQYLTSGDVAKSLKISKKTLYRWEEDGKIPKAKRHSMNKYRVYTKDDIEKIRKIITKGLK